MSILGLPKWFSVSLLLACLATSSACVSSSGGAPQTEAWPPVSDIERLDRLAAAGGYRSPAPADDLPSVGGTPFDTVAEAILSDWTAWQSAPTYFQERACARIEEAYPRIALDGFQGTEGDRSRIAVFRVEGVSTRFLLVPGVRNQVTTGIGVDGIGPFLLAETELDVKGNDAAGSVGGSLSQTCRTSSWFDAAVVCMRLGLSLPSAIEWEHGTRFARIVDAGQSEPAHADHRWYWSLSLRGPGRFLLCGTDRSGDPRGAAAAPSDRRGSVRPILRLPTRYELR